MVCGLFRTVHLARELEELRHDHALALSLFRDLYHALLVHHEMKFPGHRPRLTCCSRMPAVACSTSVPSHDLSESKVAACADSLWRL